MTDRAVVLLEYGSHNRLRRRFRRVIVVIVCIALGASDWNWRIPIAGRARLLYWQHQCATYSPAADQIAYEPDAVRALRLGTLPEYTHPPNFYDNSGDVTLTLPCAVLTPTCWTNLHQQRPALESGIFGVVFLHARRSTGGHERLVFVEPYDWSDRTSALIASSYPLKNLFSHRDSSYFIAPGDVVSEHPKDWVFKCPLEDLRLWSGHADSKDESHFTVRYQIGEAFGTVDGWLKDDDSVLLQNRVARFSTTGPYIIQRRNESDAAPETP